ncbi:MULTISPECIES: hypothetical protein [Pseudoalteromonas]|uniref:hypothetical protein n=1 Tax=Pseudoalteromonas TaxID=53246 RepID=UPI0014872B11|nr:MULTISPECIES: hypothetical protein [Pseudoalteromonas]MCG7545395.1 hypothetical protein [Pseudoalteromonas sp. MM17-2]
MKTTVTNICNQETKKSGIKGFVSHGKGFDGFDEYIAKLKAQGVAAQQAKQQ